MNYEIIIPSGGAIGEFISARTNHTVSGSGSDKWTIYATSPSWNSIMGSAVEITGDTMVITY
jgi:hypothetical protein